MLSHGTELICITRNVHLVILAQDGSNIHVATPVVLHVHAHHGTDPAEHLDNNNARVPDRILGEEHVLPHVGRVVAWLEDYLRAALHLERRG